MPAVFLDNCDSLSDFFTPRCLGSAAICDNLAVTRGTGQDETTFELGATRCLATRMIRLVVVGALPGRELLSALLRCQLDLTVIHDQCLLLHLNQRGFSGIARRIINTALRCLVIGARQKAGFRLRLVTGVVEQELRLGLLGRIRKLPVAVSCGDAD